MKLKLLGQAWGCYMFFRSLEDLTQDGEHQDYLNLSLTTLLLMKVLSDLYNLGISLYSGQIQDFSDPKLPTNSFLFLPLGAC